MTSRVSAFANHPAHAVVGVPLRVILGVVFVYASWYKLAMPNDFAVSIAMYEMVPLWLINVMAITLPAIELVVGVTLILGLWTRASVAVINAMLVMFIIAIAYVVYIRGLAEFGCGCFSPAAEEASGEMATGTLVRDVVYLAAGFYVMLFDNGTLGIDGLVRRMKRKRAKHAPEN